MDVREMEASWSVLILEVPGFRVSSQSHVSSVATLSFEFELDCQAPCELTFLEASPTHFLSLPKYVCLSHKRVFSFQMNVLVRWQEKQ
jgi:hypothetical protein